MKQKKCRLYLITPEFGEPKHFSQILESALDAGDVAYLQLRHKQLSRDQLLHAIDILRPIVQQRNIPFLLNDFPELARISGCDGVHIGNEDMPYFEARKLVGNKNILGVTCLDSIDDAYLAAKKGADYVAFGAFFPTKTKTSKGNPSIEILAKWSQTNFCPSVAIGGINLTNCSQLIETGVDYLAVISSVWDHPSGPNYSIKRFNKIING